MYYYFVLNFICMKKAFLMFLMGLLLLVGCKKNDPSPSSSNNNNNPGGGIDTTGNGGGPTYDCNLYYENLRYHGKNFKFLAVYPCSSINYNDSINGQLIGGKNYLNPAYNYDLLIHKTGKIQGYDKYNKTYTGDVDFLPSLSDIKSEISSKGYYRIPEVNNNGDNGGLDTTVHVGYWVDLYGYDPDTKMYYSSWSINGLSSDDFYFQIDKMTHLQDDNYIIEGKKKILLVNYHDMVTTYDTIQSKFKILAYFKQ